MHSVQLGGIPSRSTIKKHMHLLKRSNDLITTKKKRKLLEKLFPTTIINTHTSYVVIHVNTSGDPFDI